MIEPLPSRIAREAETRIRDGSWPRGSRLPPERELCRILGVGRSTLRLALDELEELGLVTRHQGRGTFVARARLDADTAAFFTLSAALAAQGEVLETRVLDVDRVPAGRALAEELRQAPESLVVRIRRLRLVGGEPVILEAAALPDEAFPGLDRHDVATRSLYDILRQEYGCAPTAATETLEPVLLTAREATELATTRRSPALLVRRVTQDASGSVIEVARALLRGDRTRFLLRRRVDDGATLTWPPAAPAIELVHAQPAGAR